MRKMKGFWRFGALVALACICCSLVAAGELTARLMSQPQTAGLHLTVESVAFEGDSLEAIHLILGNFSGNLLTLDMARSSFAGPDGDARALESVVDGRLTPVLLPGAATACAIRAPIAVKEGDVLKLSLFWTLGAASHSATWIWEVADVVIAAQPAPTMSVSTPPPVASPAAQSAAPLPPPGDAAGDSFIGLVALALGIGLLALLGWGLWTLGALVW